MVTDRKSSHPSTSHLIYVCSWMFGLDSVVPVWALLALGCVKELWKRIFDPPTHTGENVARSCVYAVHPMLAVITATCNVPEKNRSTNKRIGEHSTSHFNRLGFGGKLQWVVFCSLIRAVPDSKKRNQKPLII